MANEAWNVLSPVGRLVQGHPMELQDVTDDRTKQPKLKLDGSKVQQVYIGMAFPKGDQAFEQIRAGMAQVAQRDWPSGEWRAPAFAWKIIDGDSVDKKGKPYSDRPGFAGHWVLKCASGYVGQVVGPDGVRVITDANEVKRGFYGRVYLSIKGNNPSQSPGLYVNIGFFQLMYAGEVINSGPDVSAVLAAAAPVGAMPVGAIALGAPPAGGMPAMPHLMGNIPMPGMPQQQQPMTPQAIPQHPAAMPGMMLGAPQQPMPAMPRQLPAQYDPNVGATPPGYPGAGTVPHGATPAPGGYGAVPPMPGSAPVAGGAPSPYPAAPQGYTPNPGIMGR